MGFDLALENLAKPLIFVGRMRTSALADPGWGQMTVESRVSRFVYFQVVLPWQRATITCSVQLGTISTTSLAHPLLDVML